MKAQELEPYPEFLSREKVGVTDIYSPNTRTIHLYDLDISHSVVKWEACSPDTLSTLATEMHSDSDSHYDGCPVSFCAIPSGMFRRCSFRNLEGIHLKARSK